MMPRTAMNLIDPAVRHCIDECVRCHEVCLSTIPYCLEQGGEQVGPRPAVACARVDGGPGRPDGRTQRVRQRLDDGELLGRTDAAPPGDDHARLAQLRALTGGDRLAGHDRGAATGGRDLDDLVRARARGRHRLHGPRS